MGQTRPYPSSLPEFSRHTDCRTPRSSVSSDSGGDAPTRMYQGQRTARARAGSTRSAPGVGTHPLRTIREGSLAQSIFSPDNSVDRAAAAAITGLLPSLPTSKDLKITEKFQEAAMRIRAVGEDDVSADKLPEGADCACSEGAPTGR